MNSRNRMEMMRIAKDVEEEWKEEDDDGERREVKKGGYERVGQKDWTGLLMRKWGSQPRDATRSFQSGGSNPSQKTGPSGSNTNSTLSLVSSARKNDGGPRSGTTERWKGISTMMNSKRGEQRVFVSNVGENTTLRCINVQNELLGF